ncbi:DEKNAAC102734 [Brettanomyces naardenensis]|uniref:EKC/KEOPS complex subunit GON7 n=1 Tax=Brettanomyces naardenensis TaxID=13370 RepID=A0A448YKF0_BRENA|nr:DEKNAAC102734 [Brettanomyces naardenensis]
MTETNELVPSACYTAPDLEKEFMVSTSAERTTNGSTTGPSDYLLRVTEGDYVDKDRSREGKDTRIGRLRGYVTSLQDQVNVFLTTRMNESKQAANEKAEEESIERRVLDEGADTDDDDDDDKDDELIGGS